MAGFGLRPSTVTVAIYALLAQVLLTLVGNVIVLLNADLIARELLERLPPPTNNQIFRIGPSGYDIKRGAMLVMLVAVVWLLVILAARQGRNAARIVIWVVGSAYLVYSIPGLSDEPLPVLTVIGVLSVVLIPIALILLALQSSNDWYRA